MYSHLQGAWKLSQTAHSPAPGCVWTGVAFSKDAKLQTYSRLRWKIWLQITSSVKTNNNITRVDDRDVSFIFHKFLKKLKGQGKMKEQCPIPHKACRVFLQKSSNSLLWHTSSTRKMNEKRNTQNSDSDTRHFFQNLDWKLYESLNLDFKKKKGKRSLFIIEKAIKIGTTEKVSAVTERWVYPPSTSPPKEWPIHAVTWATLMKKSKPGQSQKLSQNIGHATPPGQGHIRCQWDQDIWWEQHCFYSYRAAGSFPSRGKSLVNFMEFMIGSALPSIAKSKLKVGINSKWLNLLVSQA